MYNNFQNPYMMQQPRFQTMEQPQINNYQQPMQPTLLGKNVDSIDVVKAMDIPLGSIGYFPLQDGSGIITKSWNNDGTTKITEYKPIETKKDTIKYLTREDLETALKEFDFSRLDDLEDELKDIKKQLKGISVEGWSILMTCRFSVSIFLPDLFS